MKRNLFTKDEITLCTYVARFGKREFDENDIYILSDEVYEHIIFDGHQHESLALHPTLIPKSFIVGSFGKTFHTTGWQMGYCIAPPALSFEFRKVHQYVTFSAFTPAQYAIAEYIKNKDHYLQLPRFYEQKRNFFLELMKNSRFQFTPAKGTYFQLMSFENIDQTDDITFANWLVQKIKVASIPISPFYTFKNSTPVVRFCFAKKEETLINAAEKLCKI